MIKRAITVPKTKCDGRKLATLLVACAERFKAQTIIHTDDNRLVNAKSIMGVLHMCITKGDRFTLESNGTDEEDAIDAIAALIESGFES